jgi:hypothetical protein
VTSLEPLLLLLLLLPSRFDTRSGLGVDLSIGGHGVGVDDGVTLVYGGNTKTGGLVVGLLGSRLLVAVVVNMRLRKT